MAILITGSFQRRASSSERGTGSYVPQMMDILPRCLSTKVSRIGSAYYRLQQEQMRGTQKLNSVEATCNNQTTPSEGGIFLWAGVREKLAQPTFRSMLPRRLPPLRHSS
jgi:hypothetical protein